MRRAVIKVLSLALALGILTALPAAAEVERFTLPQETATWMMRLTNDPSWRDWANYHIRNCWSPDGRFVCTVRYRQYDADQDGGPFVRVIEVATGEVVRVFERANTPRWAHDHPWLFFVQRPEEGGPEHVMWWDMAADRVLELPGRASSLGSTDFRDEFIYASNVTMPDGGSARGARIPIDGGRPQELPLGGQLDANPRNPRVYTRVTNYFEPFKPTRLSFDPDGSDISVASTCLQQCHQSWSGAGTWYLFGNQPMKGRRWDEPFPGNQHYLSVMTCGDICRGARTDRYLVGSGATRSIVVADLRSGGGHVVVPEALSYIHDSPDYAYSGDSAYYDNDAKGSPDGTKICFVSSYDLRDGPLTHISKRASEETGPGLHVRSTEGFPESGRLSVRSEVIGYASRTETTFESLTRGLYDTGPPYLREWDEQRLARATEYPDDLRAGWTVTSFDARLIPGEQIRQMQMPARFDREDWPDRDTPLMWQRRTDVYVAVARTPDRPWLRRAGATVEVIPGEHHFETRGYRILRDGDAITGRPIVPGETLQLPAGGDYTAVALEHSGLESEPSNALTLPDRATLQVREEPPAGFSWTSRRWFIGGTSADEQAARAAAEAVCEITHRYDGVIHREWYEQGERVRRHDLDAAGNAIRRTFYEDGRLMRREYHTVEGEHRTTELFDADGFITESVYYRRGAEWDHWWYIKAPVKLVAERGGHHTASPEGAGTYVKRGIDWVKID